MEVCPKLKVCSAFFLKICHKQKVDYYGSAHAEKVIWKEQKEEEKVKEEQEEEEEICAVFQKHVSVILCTFTNIQ